MPFFSHRVNFETGGGSALCGENVVKIARAFPPNLEDHQTSYTNTNWDDFCNQIDSVLETLAATRKRNAQFSCFLMGAAMALLIISPIVTRIFLRSVFGDFWYVIMFATASLPIFGTCYLMTSAKTKDKQIMNDLQYLCKEATERNPGISFMLKRELVHRGSKSAGAVKFIVVENLNVPDPRRRRPHTPDTLASTDDFQTPIGDGGDRFHGLSQEFVPGDENQVEFVSAFDRLQASPAMVDPSQQV
jgi:hypothetical protein